MPNLPLALDLVALKATVILVGAMLLAFVLRRASGGTRHSLWTTTTVALLALPVLESQLPQLSVPWPVPVQGGEVVAPHDEAQVMPIPLGSGATVLAADQLHLVRDEAVQPDSTGKPRGLAAWLGITWLLGMVGFAIPVLLGVFRSRRLMARAIAVTDPRLVHRFYRAADDVGVPVDVALRVSPAVRTPMTGGVLRPMVLLPEVALQWSDDCVDAVLRHELVHVRQRDALRQLASRLSVALYWFHPLAWRAARLGALAREMACDESVLRLGTRPSGYARHLLALADPMPAPVGMPALVRLDHPHLEERVMAILRASPPPASRRLSISAAVLIACWTAVVAAAAPPVAEAVAEERAEAAVESPVVLAPLAAELSVTPVVATDSPLAVQAADCENLRDARARSVAGNGGQVRMFTSEHEGTRLCVTVRGDNADRNGFIPRGQLPNGVVLTMGSSNSDGERRLEIEGTDSGNEHRWFVDGRARPFDSRAAEWRDAMLELVGVLTARSEVEHARAAEAMGVARRDMERSRVAMARSLDAQHRALPRVHVDQDLAVASNQLEREAVIAGRTAEAHARRAVEEARHAQGVAVVAPRVARGHSADVAEMRAREVASAQRHQREVMAADRREMEERRVEVQRHAAELRAHARELEREQRRVVEELHGVAPLAPLPPLPPVAPDGPRAGGVAVLAPDQPPAVRRVPAAPPAPSMREREVDPRAVAAADRLRAAIRASGGR